MVLVPLPSRLRTAFKKENITKFFSELWIYNEIHKNVGGIINCKQSLKDMSKILRMKESITFKVQLNHHFHNSHSTGCKNMLDANRRNRNSESCEVN